MTGQSRGQVMDKIRNHKHIEDIEVIGSGAFSYWRGLTHWDYMYNLGPEECGIFLCLLRRLKELSRRK